MPPSLRSATSEFELNASLICFTGFKNNNWSEVLNKSVLISVLFAGGRSRSKRHRADNIDIEERLEKLILNVGDKVRMDTANVLINLISL